MIDEIFAKIVFLLHLLTFERNYFKGKSHIRGRKGKKPSFYLEFGLYSGISLHPVRV